MITHEPIVAGGDLAPCHDLPRIGSSNRPDDRMTFCSIDSRVGTDASRRACRRNLLSMGVGERQAAQMADDEFADGRPEPLCRVAADDQRVFPHRHGWLVTRDFDAGGARLFQDRIDAEGYARREAKREGKGSGHGILFYDQDGCALVYVSFPAWRQENRLRSLAW